MLTRCAWIYLGMSDNHICCEMFVKFLYISDTIWNFSNEFLRHAQINSWYGTNAVHCLRQWWPSILVPIVYLKKYAHGFVVLCFVVVMQSFITNSHEVFIHIHQGCFAGTGAIVRLPQCQWSKPDGYGKISQCITTTKHSKAKTVCIFLGIYCICVSKLQWAYKIFHRNYVQWLLTEKNDLFVT